MKNLLFIIVVCLMSVPAARSFGSVVTECPSNQDPNTWSNCTGSYTNLFGTISGQFKDGKLHGKGSVNFLGGLQIDGDFKYGKLNGKAIMLDIL